MILVRLINKIRNYNKTKLFEINMKSKDQNLINYSKLQLPNVIYSPFLFFCEMCSRKNLVFFVWRVI